MLYLKIYIELILHMDRHDLSIFVSIQTTFYIEMEVWPLIYVKAGLTSAQYFEEEKSNT